MHQPSLVVVLFLAYAARFQGLPTPDKTAPDVDPKVLVSGRGLKENRAPTSDPTLNEERGLTDIAKGLRTKLFGATAVENIRAADSAVEVKRIGRLRFMWNQIKKMEVKGDVKYMIVIYALLALGTIGILASAIAINHNVSSQYIHD